LIGLLDQNEPVIVDLTDNAAGTIGRTVVNNEKFNSYVVFAKDFINQTTNSRSGVVNRDNDANVDFIFHAELRTPFVTVVLTPDRDNSSFPDFLVDIK